MRSCEQLAGHVLHAHRRAPAVSAWSVGQHLEHSFISATGIIRQLAASIPGQRRRAWSLLWTVVSLTGHIPRGRGVAPPAVHPQPEPTAERLAEVHAEAVANLGRVDAIDPRAWFLHPVFGVLERRGALRFIDIHHRHHAKIIRDILAR